MPDNDQQLVDQQIRYYRQRAPEYDEWFHRQGRYDHGPDHTRLWQQEIAVVRAALDGLKPAGRILERPVAQGCGHSNWRGMTAL